MGYIFALLASITWGLIYALDEKVLFKVSPITLMVVYYVVSFVLFIPFIFLKKQELLSLRNLHSNDLLFIFATCLLTIIGEFFILSSIKNLDASLASILEISYPFFVVLFSVLILGSRISIPFAVGGILIFLGSFIILRYA